MHTWICVLAAASLVLGCSPTADKPDAANACTPGHSVACGGPGGCKGMQSCKDDGSGYETCQCGPVSDAGADADGAAAWTPSELTANLALWLEGDVGVTLNGQSVDMWLDQSGHGYAAAPFSTSAQPHPQTAVVGAHTVVRFANSDPLGVASPALKFPADFAVEFVVGSSNASATELVFSKVATTNPGIQLELMPSPPVVVKNPQVTPTVSGGTASALDGKLHVVGVRRTGSACEVRVDGVATVGDTSHCAAVLVDSPSAQFVLGGSEQGDVTPALDVAEVVVLTAALSDADVAKLEAYFKAKYTL